MTYKNLEPGQFQLGDLVMGEWTLFKIESLDIGNYDVNVQDFQPPASNELYFGQDSLKPAPIQLTINVQKNKVMENVVALTGSTKILNFDNDPNLADLQREWRATDVMQAWGRIKPLFFCGTDGITRQFFGRPGKFAYKLHKVRGSAFYACQAEFRRSDTFAFSETEYFETFDPDDDRSISLTRGNAPSWVRFLIVGPANNPIINFGSKAIELESNIPAGKVVEITSYPWLGRRVVDSDGLSLASKLVIEGDPYLEHVYFDNHSSKLISWTATSTTGASKMVLLWHDGYQVMD